jgi:competence protein ComEA
MKPWPVSLGVLIGLLAGGLILLVSSSPGGDAIRILPPPSPAPLVVQVSGAVARPGVYNLPQGSRVKDAIHAAGDMTANADPGALNLAALLEDGQRVEVPLEGAPPQTSGEPPSRSVTIPGGLVNINTATQAELEGLPEIGPTLAQRIVEYRQAHGPFATIEAIQDVEGIGEGVFEKIKGLITVR